LAVLRSAATRHLQHPRRPISHREASGHRRRYGPRPRSAQHEVPDLRKCWDQAIRDEHQRYRSRSSGQVGAETSS
jgi:hypothetical protein